jgi:DNA-binding response OmpR family regulator
LNPEREETGSMLVKGRGISLWQQAALAILTLFLLGVPAFSQKTNAPFDPIAEREYWENLHKREQQQAKAEEEWENEHREQAIVSVSNIIVEAQALQPKLIEAEDGLIHYVPDSRSLISRYPQHFGLGTAITLGFILTGMLTIRFRREAEIRKLCGGYLSDGTEVASFKMPEWFAPQKAVTASASREEKPDWFSDREPVTAEKSQTEKFLEMAPELLIQIRQALRALGRAGNELEYQAALAQLPEHVTRLKEQANFWEMRPVWQMSSALELLVKRIAEKPKDATPSTMRTISAATDLLQKLCTTGIRPNLIIDPPIKILAVDDDPLCLRALTFALQKANIVPDTANNGVKALAQANDHVYDVIFMDIQMPEMDGLTACKRIHETEANADTPVVFVTIQSDFHTRAQSTAIGGSDLMAKPFLVFELAVKALTVTMRKRLQLQKATAPSGVVPAAGASESARAKIAANLVETKPLEPTVLAEAKPVAEVGDDEAETEPGFLSEAKGYIVAMRKALEEVELAPDEAQRKERLGDLYLKVHSFAAQSVTAGLPLAARVASTLESLVKKLFEKPAKATVSTRSTIATTLDLLEELRVPGRRQKLTDDSPVHLLVVDDEPLARRAITGALQLAFDKPDNAADGKEALTLAGQKTYDVIFTDIQMPELDGFGLCTELRANGNNRTTPVVFITSQDDGDARDKARKSGGNDFIAKPCLPSEVTMKALTFVVRKRLHLTEQDGSNSISSANSSVSEKPASKAAEDNVIEQVAA